MIASRIIRNAATTIDIHTIGYEDLTNAMGEARLLLARLTIEKEARLNAKAKESAKVIHDDEQKERDEFEKHVRSTIEDKH
jgi:hypothetical protein